MAAQEYYSSFTGQQPQHAPSYAPAPQQQPHHSYQQQPPHPSVHFQEPQNPQQPLQDYQSAPPPYSLLPYSPQPQAQPQQQQQYLKPPPQAPYPSQLHQYQVLPTPSDPRLQALRPARTQSEPPDNRRDRSRQRHRRDSHSRDSRSRSRPRVHERNHRDRDTFLGAGGGALVGDAIFPGLGTLGGLLLGGYGGRKHAEKRGRSEMEARRR